jgi:hypothetical protein
MLDIVALSFVLADGSVGLGVGFLSAKAKLARDTKTRVAANFFIEFSIRCEVSVSGSEMLLELQRKREVIA